MNSELFSPTSPSPHPPTLFPTGNSELGTRNLLSTQHFALSTLVTPWASRKAATLRREAS
uniref:Uncharacterized protein n=1 Tax=Desertifilum tharense IPPAS B-1220 TaxID=1781255 RepID=A0ACD5H3N2_9CYAN